MRKVEKVIQKSTLLVRTPLDLCESFLEVALSETKNLRPGLDRYQRSSKLMYKNREKLVFDPIVSFGFFDQDFFRNSSLTGHYWFFLRMGDGYLATTRCKRLKSSLTLLSVIGLDRNKSTSCAKASLNLSMSASPIAVNNANTAFCVSGAARRRRTTSNPDMSGSDRSHRTT